MWRWLRLILAHQFNSNFDNFCMWQIENYLVNFNWCWFSWHICTWFFKQLCDLHCLTNTIWLIVATMNIWKNGLWTLILNVFFWNMNEVDLNYFIYSLNSRFICSLITKENLPFCIIMIALLAWKETWMQMFFFQIANFEELNWFFFFNLKNIHYDRHNANNK